MSAPAAASNATGNPRHEHEHEHEHGHGHGHGKSSRHDLERLLAWFNTNVRPYLPVAGIVIAVAVVALLIATVVRAGHHDRLARGFHALEKAVAVDDVKTVAADYKGTSLGALALIDSARRLYRDGQFEQAETTFALFRKQYPGSPMVTAATIGEAYSMEAAGKTAQAETAFAGIAETAADNALAFDAMLGASRCAELQGRTAEAAEWLTKARTKVDPESPAAATLNERVDTAAQLLRAKQNGAVTNRATVAETETPTDTPPAAE